MDLLEEERHDAPVGGLDLSAEQLREEHQIFLVGAVEQCEQVVGGPGVEFEVKLVVADALEDVSLDVVPELEVVDVGVEADQCQDHLAALQLESFEL